MASSFSNQCSRQSVRGAGLAGVVAMGDVAMAGYSLRANFRGGEKWGQRPNWQLVTITKAGISPQSSQSARRGKAGVSDLLCELRELCGESLLEVGPEFAEGGENDEFADAGEDGLVLELPGVLVRDVDGVEADLHGGIDIAARAVADHPRGVFYDFVFADEEIVGLGILFADDFDELEKSLEAGALDLGSLLCGLAFGEENEAVALGEIGERFGNAIENFRRRAFEFDDAIVNLRERFALRLVFGELHVGLFERAAEAADAVAVLANVFALGFVEDVADVGARVAAGLDEGDEIFDQFFEEDVVFPEGVVGVDEKGVSAHCK